MSRVKSPQIFAALATAVGSATVALTDELTVHCGTAEQLDELLDSDMVAVDGCIARCLPADLVQYADRYIGGCAYALCPVPFTLPPGAA
jgi:hypothetical protein